MHLKVLLVDDEFLVRLGIKSLIDWEQHQLIYVGDAQDGLEALEIIEKTKPDIILTDIVMPRMNGIELIEKVKSEYPDTHIIVLSSHNDYEYVRKAMKLGVEDYILKASLKPEELLQMLLEVSKKIASSREVRQRQIESKPAVEPSDNGLSRQLKHWIYQRNAASEENGIKEEEKAYFLNGYVFVLITIHRDQHRSDRSDKQKLMNLLALQLNKNTDALFHDVNEEEIVLLFPKKEGGLHLIDVAIRFAKEIIDAAKRFINLSISIGISEESNGIESMPDVYAKAKRALQMYFYEGKERVYVYGDHLEDTHAGSVITQEDETVLKVELDRMNAAGIKHVLERIFDRMEKWKGPVDKCIQLCLQLLHTIQNGLKPYQPDMFKHLEQEEPLYKQVLKLEELSTAKQWFEQLIDDCCGQGKSIGGGNFREDIQQLILYMKTNYKEDISLRHAAEMVRMSENYLSFLFKKETQVGFSEYLNQIRVGKAAELLLESKLPVYAIAERVGYENFNYFGRIFKKTMGVSPQQYRSKFQSSFT
ncbi:response regulator [Paenibacillus planticolens]|uniref:Response regulator n=1 Tax=Paenibacillus planticolens TaxID=2654976 RepID=A0ABX1ZPB6_9BACL|nr:response regulator [Paenibacillus planticolens]NOV00723.1 response regulator [Paenibacillus planticolens]